MRSIIRGIKNENGTLKGLTGQGEPGFSTLLGGTSPELDAESYQLGGGSGQVSSVSRLARANRDIYVSAVAAGRDPTEFKPERPPVDPVIKP